MNEPLQDAILNGLYDPDYPGHEFLSPKLLQNANDDNIWLSLRQELLHCQDFTWAVAFVTPDMLVPFKVVMADLAAKGVSGTLITGDYLAFNDPKVFHELMKIPNLVVKIAETDGFHAKGYLFNHADWQTVVVGSANFTRSALLCNYEWALKISSKENATLARQLAGQLRELQATSRPLTTDWLKKYEDGWVRPQRGSRPQVKSQTAVDVVPNKMQEAALKELQDLVESGQKRGLIVSATGTGKTYLGAFAVKDFKPHKFLYVVHR
ncbi:NgoFVII family restriction endonuclease, partial [Lactobacillus sp. XV13L]|nr:NgoFVII family restriction endonuclease [Lactobacillus sp. XV13L]